MREIGRSGVGFRWRGGAIVPWNQGLAESTRFFGSAVTGFARESNLGWEMGGEGGTLASRRQTGRRDRVSLALGFFLSGRGTRGAWMQAAWRPLEQGAGVASGAEIEVTRV